MLGIYLPISPIFLHLLNLVCSSCISKLLSSTISFQEVQEIWGLSAVHQKLFRFIGCSYLLDTTVNVDPCTVYVFYVAHILKKCLYLFWSCTWNSGDTSRDLLPCFWHLFRNSLHFLRQLLLQEKSRFWEFTICLRIIYTATYGSYFHIPISLNTPN